MFFDILGKNKIWWKKNNFDEISLIWVDIRGFLLISWFLACFYIFLLGFGVGYAHPILLYSLRVHSHFCLESLTYFFYCSFHRGLQSLSLKIDYVATWNGSLGMGPKVRSYFSYKLIFEMFRNLICPRSAPSEWRNPREACFSFPAFYGVCGCLLSACFYFSCSSGDTDMCNIMHEAPKIKQPKYMQQIRCQKMREKG